MPILLQDLRFAFRQILRSLGFSLTAVLSLTLGIGATVAVYSILYDAVLHPAQPQDLHDPRRDAGALHMGRGRSLRSDENGIRSAPSVQYQDQVEARRQHGRRRG